MAGTWHLCLLVAFLSVATLIGASVAVADDSPPPAPTPKPTAYEMLERFNLTQGILPQGVTRYVLNTDGSFEVYLPANCSLRAGSMQIQYSSRITGHIQPLSITRLEGVNAKVIVSWIGVEQVHREGDQIRFSAGRIYKTFSVNTFAKSLQCKPMSV